MHVAASTPSTTHQPVAPAAYTAEDVAALLQISTRTVHRLAAAGTLPGRLHVGRSTRFLKRDVDAWISGGCKTARGR